MAVPTQYDGLEPYDFLMESMIQKSIDAGSTVDQKQIENLMTLIAYHESAGTMDPSIRQFEGGPGMGIFQYELQPSAKHTKASGAGRTAMGNLLLAYGGEDDPRGAYDKLPKWAKAYFNITNKWGYPNPEGDVDFSTLTLEQQEVLFLADKLMTIGAVEDIGKLASHEWWAKYHRKAPGSDVQKFSNDAARYSIGEFRKTHNIMKTLTGGSSDLDPHRDQYNSVKE
tara:strand:- start:1701 stop:2378 length:678 start_codon:yes stop_codon:yes gene_type:complete